MSEGGGLSPVLPPADPAGEEPRASALEELQTSAGRCRELFVALQQELSQLKSKLDDFDAAVEEREAELQGRVARLEQERRAVERVMAPAGATVKLNVGGVHYETALQTLVSQPESMLAAMFSGRYGLQLDEQGRHFIDRDGRHFDVVLNYLRDGSVGQILDDYTRDRVLREARFYMLDGLVAALSPRAEGGGGTGTFRWDHFSPHVLTDPSCTTVSTQATTWVHSWSGEKLSEGVHYWEIKLDAYDTRNSLNVAVGVTRNPLSPACIMGYSYNSHAWAYVCGTGRVSHNKSYSIPYAEPSLEGDTVGVRLDCDSGVIEFFRDGRSMGIAFDNVQPPVYPAVSLTHRQQVTLCFPSHIPPGVLQLRGAARGGQPILPRTALVLPPADKVYGGHDQPDASPSTPGGGCLTPPEGGVG
eukprot:Hpha_TRINITY_DN10237_c0_g1::TRINITY_DN10237_c0_g1_i1::g.34896::m.34896